MRGPLHVRTVLQKILQAHKEGGERAAESVLEKTLRLVGVGSNTNPKYCLPLYDVEQMFKKDWVSE